MGGFTQNIIMREGEIVTKTGKTAKAEAEWYQAYQEKGHIPKIYSSNDVSLSMEYLESVGPVDLDAVLQIVSTYYGYPLLNDLKFSAYRERIAKHLSESPICNGWILKSWLSGIELSPTFAHGDLSIRNIIQTTGGPKLIDPLYGPTFGNFTIDLAKLAFSLKFYNGDVDGFERVKAFAKCPFFDVLVASECVRVATYNRKFDFIAENLINEL